MVFTIGWWFFTREAPRVAETCRCREVPTSPPVLRADDRRRPAHSAEPNIVGLANTTALHDHVVAQRRIASRLASSSGRRLARRCRPVALPLLALCGRPRLRPQDSEVARRANAYRQKSRQPDLVVCDESPGRFRPIRASEGPTALFFNVRRFCMRRFAITAASVVAPAGFGVSGAMASPPPNPGNPAGTGQPGTATPNGVSCPSTITTPQGLQQPRLCKRNFPLRQSRDDPGQQPARGIRVRHRLLPDRADSLSA